MYAICISAQGAPTTSPEQSIERAFEVGNFELGLRLAEAAVRQTPRNVKLWAFEGIALSHLGHPSRALEAYNHALEISPDYLPALEGAAELQYNLATERAVPLLNRILKIHPADPTAHAMMGVLAYKRHDCRSAVSHFRASKELISSQAAALAEYGSCLVDLELPEDAIPVFQQLLALEPADTHARYNLAVVEFNAHQAKSALSTLEPLLDATPSDPDALELAASAYEESGDTPNAVRLLRQAIALNPKNPKYYVDVATISFNHQSFQVGVDMINAGLTENPEAAVLYVARGILYVQLGRYGQGEADFETANRLDPRQTSGAVAQGLAQIEQSNLDRARSTVELELKSHPRDPFLHFLKAQILFQKSGQPQSKEFQDAIGAASLAVEIEPDLVLARDLLASLYLKSGQLEQSIAQSRRALKENPSDQEALYHLIQALRQSGKDKGELPGLVKRLAAARQESRNAEALGNKYKLYEPPAESSPSLAK
ncbi:MAG: tetratricopeptide repeat protein [Acidobacteria bacterium]|nr:tetratricopeptide repeat protein [Acidobacteriota bacterium]